MSAKDLEEARRLLRVAENARSNEDSMRWTAVAQTWAAIAHAEAAASDVVVTKGIAR